MVEGGTSNPELSPQGRVTPLPVSTVGRSKQGCGIQNMNLSLHTVYCVSTHLLVTSVPAHEYDDTKGRNISHTLGLLQVL
jgi:hypothetical protein